MRAMIWAGLAMAAAPTLAQDAARTGPVFDGFGPHFPVEGIETVPADTEFAHSFDVARKAEGEQRNRGFESAARFINMHAAHGVDPDNMRVAVVVHGSAVLDLLTDEARAARDLGATNPSGDMSGAIPAPTGGASADAVSALENLGFKPAVAARAVAAAQGELGESASEGDLIRVALKKAAG